MMVFDMRGNRSQPQVKLEPFLIERYGCNSEGRDWIVGDVHGQFGKLQKALYHFGFEPNKGDRLFHVGDLVGRGFESEYVLDWLGQPWVYSIRGNHEDMLIGYHEGRFSPRMLLQNGEGWFLDLPESEQKRYVDRLKNLPYAIELDSPHGTVLIVHADFYLDSWQKTLNLAQSHPDALKSVQQNLLWSRDRLNGDWVGENVEDVFCVVSGHSVVSSPVRMGNRVFLDTGGWLMGRDFAFFDTSDNTVIMDID